MNYDGTILTVNLHALAGNYVSLRAMAGVNTAGVLKADAYGVGLEPVARTLMDVGCRDFFVVTVAEGVRLRKVCPYNIYLLGGIHSGPMAAIKEHNLIPVLNCLEDIAAYKGPCAIHFDTGMNRLGLCVEETRKVMDNHALLSHLDVKLAISHFVAADEKDSPITMHQRQLFAQIHMRLKDVLPDTQWSLCNSAGILTGCDVYDMVRPGYALYGGHPTPWIAAPSQPVVSLDAQILQVRRVKAGGSIGYNATYICKEDSVIGTVCLGYADGWLRSFSNQGVLYWEGVPCPIVGRVSMDSFGVDLTHLINKPRAGDKLEVLGKHQSIDAAAATGGTIGYELLTSLGSRYQRVYI